MEDNTPNPDYKQWFDVSSKVVSVLTFLLITLIGWQASTWNKEVSTQNVLTGQRISALELWQAEAKGNRFTLQDAKDMQGDFIRAIEKLSYITKEIERITVQTHENTTSINILKEKTNRAQ